MVKLLAIIWCSCCFLGAVVPCFGQDIPFKGVNLDNWLVVEGWLLPSLFDQIPINKDLLDGTQLQLKSLHLNKYLSAVNGGGDILVANGASPSGSETFRLWRVNGTSFNLRVFNKLFVGLGQDNSNVVVAQSTLAGPSETFQIVRNQKDQTKIRLRGSNGFFLQAKSETSVVADYAVDEDWGDDNPSVFQMTIVHTLRGEYQLTNGLGPDIAQRVMQEHWSTYIVEEDFKFMSENGLTAVRIPVGWWIKYDQNPPKPFVAGSLQALDNAFTWSENHNMKVIIDLHAFEHSQNGNEHSGTRDGYADWGASDISSSVQVIEFLAQRYANRPSLGAIELMNEPSRIVMKADTLTKYYKAGYDAVRRHTSSAYVIFSNILGDESNTEFIPLAQSLDRTVIDVHYYNLFTSNFNSLDVQGNIDYIYNQRSVQLQEITPSNGYPLSFVGEWTGKFMVENAGIEDYQRFVNAQINVYGNATFGWAYCSYKCVRNHWSLKWMIENNYINLRSSS